MDVKMSMLCFKMVLRPNVTSRFDENLPPITSSSKSISARLRTDLARRRRASRTTPYSYTSKYVLDQAKRRRKPRTAVSSVRFKIATIPNADIEMRDETAKRSTKTITLPKVLPRPEYCEVSREALKAASIDLASPDCPPPELVREMLPKWGPECVFICSIDTLLSFLQYAARSFKRYSIPTQGCPARRTRHPC